MEPSDFTPPATMMSAPGCIRRQNSPHRLDRVLQLGIGGVITFPVVDTALTARIGLTVTVQLWFLSSWKLVWPQRSACWPTGFCSKPKDRTDLSVDWRKEPRRSAPGPCQAGEGAGAQKAQGWKATNGREAQESGLRLKARSYHSSTCRLTPSSAARSRQSRQPARAFGQRDLDLH